MLPKVKVSTRCCGQAADVETYRRIAGDDLIDEIRELARELNGLRLCEINATATGGGVAELLARLVPAYRSLGLDVDWSLIFGDKEFFTVTKGFHNALQGGEFRITSSIADEYLDENRRAAEALETEYDVFVVHDPQPAALRHFVGDSSRKWIWRCHVDSSEPNEEVWQFLRPYIEQYDAAVFTLEVFRPPDLTMDRVVYIPPAIDPLSTKNMQIPDDLCRRVIADSGLDLRRPMLLQVSRFDPWKDPLGVIETYRLVKKERPEVQLILIGAMAGDDPEGWEMLQTINDEAHDDGDLYVFTNLSGVGNMEVNAFQRGVDLIIQKSLREGFGLVVSEALWKESPIVAGAAGGIPMQFPDGYDRYLVNSIDECAEQLLYLLEHPDEARQFGEAGREHVRQRFLLPHLIRNNLRMIRDLVT